MNQIEITASVAKTTVDAKKAVITLELDYSSYNRIPNIARMTGMLVNAVIYPSQDAIEFEDGQ